MANLLEQLKRNYLSIISLFIAVIALIHNTHLYVQSEINRNVRTASFEILMKLGELQQQVNLLHYDSSLPKNNLLASWGNIALIGDLSQLIPAPVPEKANALIAAWKANNEKIEGEESADAISNQIDATRQAVIQVIRNLS
jgi:hypothetical protein